MLAFSGNWQRLFAIINDSWGLYIFMWDLKIYLYSFVSIFTKSCQNQIGKLFLAFIHFLLLLRPKFPESPSTWSILNSNAQALANFQTLHPPISIPTFFSPSKSWTFAYPAVQNSLQKPHVLIPKQRETHKLRYLFSILNSGTGTQFIRWFDLDYSYFFCLIGNSKMPGPVRSTSHGPYPTHQ